MKLGCSIFAQILQLFPRHQFEAAVNQHHAERHARGFTCWGQFIAMMFCQLVLAKSLREICQGLAASEQANELEDRAQDLTIAENNRILGEFSARRRISIDRALAKIADGTYGFADLTGEPIPLARLQAIPDAV